MRMLDAVMLILLLSLLVCALTWALSADGKDEVM